ncbi:hypothetical protein L2E82_16137 [Cichorium intybus]|uniref:Uncharacterized protein n=1 Tax=Cichorium intybus TaxID=13427 RepID=A0ACB9F4P1_CICIN|nr:hypothetical protein L2E82_16137 [Cichorium intybus]
MHLLPLLTAIDFSCIFLCSNPRLHYWISKVSAESLPSSQARSLRLLPHLFIPHTLAKSHFRLISSSHKPFFGINISRKMTSCLSHSPSDVF